MMQRPCGCLALLLVAAILLLPFPPSNEITTESPLTVCGDSAGAGTPTDGESGARIIAAVVIVIIVLFIIYCITSAETNHKARR